MTFAPGPEAEELRAVVRAFLDRHWREPDVRRLMEHDTGYDEAVWRRLAAELGLQGLIVPERFGGSGASTVELGVVFEEMGAALYGGPFLATVGLAATALCCVADQEAATRYLPGIVGGETPATVAWGGTNPLTSTITAARNGGAAWTLTGRAEMVLDGVDARLVLVIASTAEGLGLFAIDGEPDGMLRTPLTALDSTRNLASIELHTVPATPVGTPGEVDVPLGATVDRAVTALAAEQVGGAARALRMSVDYAGSRMQFGRKIGSFQAIKHRCADMLVRLESARSAAYYAAWAATHNPADLPLAASLAGATCSETYVSVTLDNLQNHGGIGFTWEHPAHLYLKRAKTSQLFLGTPSRHRARLAALIDIPEVAA